MCVCVGVGGWGGGGCKRVSVYVSKSVCLLYPFSYFPLAFVLVNDLLSGFSLFLF